MAQNVIEHGNIFQAFLDNLQPMLEQLKDGEGAKKPSEGFSLEGFRAKLKQAADVLSHEATKMGVAFLKPFYPDSSQTETLVHGLEMACFSLVSVFYSLPKELGLTLRKQTQRTVITVVEAVVRLVKNITETGSYGAGPHLQTTGTVWEMCNTISNLPHDNKTAVLQVLKTNSTLLYDSLEELDDEVQSDENYEMSEFIEENEIHQGWSNSDKELLPHCIGLVTAAKACNMKITAAAQKNGKCDSEGNISQFDDLSSWSEGLSPLVDELVISVYPPINRQVLKENTTKLANHLRGLLNSAQSSHYTNEDDQIWIDSLLNAVEHNYSQMSQLLS